MPIPRWVWLVFCILVCTKLVAAIPDATSNTSVLIVRQSFWWENATRVVRPTCPATLKPVYLTTPAREL